MPAPTHIEPHVARVTMHPRLVAAARAVLVIAAGGSKAANLGRAWTGDDVRELPGPGRPARDGDLVPGRGGRRGASGSLIAGRAVGLRPDSELLVRFLQAALGMMLFVDASSLDLRNASLKAALAGRLLAIALPLTVVAGALVALALWPGIELWQAALVGAMLAPTDAMLAQPPWPTPACRRSCGTRSTSRAGSTTGSPSRW